MARPSVFVSSTYYDLRIVRADIERFIKEMGYEAVLYEKGHIPYGREEALEYSCYREIEKCDILVSIIGGRYGTQSKDSKHSITHRELKTAIKLGKQVYIFIEKAVYYEYKTYLQNKDVKGFKPSSVNDVRVFSFLEDIYSIPTGNPVEPFELSDDIIRFLREQWAGLFQRLLQEMARQKDVNILEKVNDGKNSENKSNGKGVWEKILLAVQSKKKSTWALLKEGRFAGIKDGEITIEFPNNCLFHKGKLDQVEEKKLIEQCAREIIHSDARLKLVISKSM